MHTLVIGGCRSGKSAYALDLAEGVQAGRKLFMATCQPYDDEMRARVARHQRERDATWETLEVPMELARTLELHNTGGSVVLVDCLTFWLTNMAMANLSEIDIQRRIASLDQTLTAMKVPVILVTNEVGQGIVPENRLARQFRDWAGLLNRRVAQSADQVVWMVAGIPVKVKPVAVASR